MLNDHMDNLYMKLCTCVRTQHTVHLSDEYDNTYQHVIIVYVCTFSMDILHFNYLHWVIISIFSLFECEIATSKHKDVINSHMEMEEQHCHRYML